MNGIPAAIESGGTEIVVGTSRTPSGGAGPIERSSLARPVLPCDGCAHGAVCSIRPLLSEAELGFRTPPSPHSAIRVRLTVTVECSHFLSAPETTPEPPTALAASRRRGAAIGLPRARAVAPGGRRGGVAGKRSEEARAHMSEAQKAAWERRRAREATA